MQKKEEETKNLTLRLPMSLYAAMIDIVEYNGMSVTKYITRAIEDKIKRDSAAKPEPTDDKPLTRADVQYIIDKTLEKYHLESIEKYPPKITKRI